MCLDYDWTCTQEQDESSDAVENLCRSINFYLTLACIARVLKKLVSASIHVTWIIYEINVSKNQIVIRDWIDTLFDSVLTKQIVEEIILVSFQLKILSLVLLFFSLKLDQTVCKQSVPEVWRTEVKHSLFEKLILITKWILS